MIRNPNDEINFPNKILLTDTQGSKFDKVFASDLSANIKKAKIFFSNDEFRNNSNKQWNKTYYKSN